MHMSMSKSWQQIGGCALGFTIAASWTRFLSTKWYNRHEEINKMFCSSYYLYWFHYQKNQRFYHETLDNNLTNSNEGSRKRRNIRDNLFVINAIANSSKKNNKESTGINVYYVIKCFDSLWLSECLNDLFDAGLTNDKLSLLFLENSNAQVAAKSASGISRRIPIRNIIMQGTVWANLCCTVLMDKLGKIMYKQPELMYK